MAWKARLQLELAWKQGLDLEHGPLVSAQNLVDEALDRRCSAWIKFRVCMAAGDLALTRWEGVRAASLYAEMSNQPIHHYGPEGDGYQTLPRLGLAELIAHDEDATRQSQDARKYFEALDEAEGIPMARLFAQYGFELGNFKSGRRVEARERIRRIRREMAQRGPPSLLARLYDRYFDRLQAQAARPR